MKKIRLVNETGGVYVHISHKPEEDVFSNFLNGINNVRTVLKKPDSVYFYPNSTVTRDHISKAKEDFKITQTRKVDSADKVVISLKYLQSLFEFDPYSRIFVVNRADLLDAFDYIIDNYETLCVNYKLKHRYWTTPLDEIKDQRNLIVQYSSVSDTEIATRTTSYLNDFLDENNPEEKKHLDLFNSLGSWSNPNLVKGYITEKNNKILQSLWKNRRNVLTEEAFISLVSQDNVATYDDFVNIQKLMKGSDDDKELAMSTLSGYSWEKHEDLLLFLWYKHSDWMRYSKVYSAASFKAIKKKVRSYNVHTNAGLLKGLLDNNTLTPKGLKVFMEDKVDEINNNWSVTHSTYKITIDGLTLPEEYNEIRSKL